MGCICPCKKLPMGCGTGIDCSCPFCRFSTTLTVDIHIIWDCPCSTYGVSPSPTSLSIIQCCDIQARYNTYYNGTYILTNSGTIINDCDDFGYEGGISYGPQPSLIANGTPPGALPFLLIAANKTELRIDYLGLEYIPCSSPPGYAGFIPNTFVIYKRNTAIDCSTTSISYKLSSRLPCLLFPPTITLEVP